MEWALATSIVALAIALTSLCATFWRTRRSYNDTDLEELADEVARLARRARADTMRRVRQEKGAAAADGGEDPAPPPQFRGPHAVQPPTRPDKNALRVQLLTSPDWRH